MHRSSSRRRFHIILAGFTAALSVLVLLSNPAGALIAADVPVVQEADEEPTSGAVVPSEPTTGRDLTASYVVAAVVVGVVIVLFVAQRRRTRQPEAD